MEIDLTRFAIHRIKVELKPHYDPMDSYVGTPNPFLICTVVLTTKDFGNIEDGSLTKQKIDAKISKEHWQDMSEYQREDFVRDLVREAVLHEVDECLFINGERIHDPHPEDPSWHARTYLGGPIKEMGYSIKFDHRITF